MPFARDTISLLARDTVARLDPIPFARDTFSLSLLARVTVSQMVINHYP